MAGKRSEPSDHKRGYDLYVRLRSFSGVAEELGIAEHTVSRWASGEVRCTCPYHNWDDLILEEDREVDKKIALLQRGILDPASHDELSQGPTLQELDQHERREIRSAWSVMVRSGVERLSQLEFLYAKLFYKITGLALDHNIVLQLSGLSIEDPTNPPNSIKELFDKGDLEPRNQEAAIKTLMAILDRIDKEKEYLGLTRSPVSGSPHKTEEDLKEVHENRQIGLQELREMKDFIKTTPRDQLEAMAETLRTEDKDRQAMEDK